MSLQLPKRAVALAAAGVGVLAAGGCSSQTVDEWKRMAMPEPVTKQGVHTLHLWQGAWIAAWITGIIVWGLIIYAVVRFRRRSADEIPIQTRYNLPLEIFYTIAPIIMVIVFFAKTVDTQNAILADVTPDNTVEVVGQQWSWTFNYGLGQQDPSANDDATDNKYAYMSYVHESGTGSYIPNLYLPVNETTRFNLHSPDVIHDLGVPAFLMRMDVVPGRVNHYEVTPTEIGDYKGKCYELCGVYHQRMLFNVHVVSQADYQKYLQGLKAASGATSKPLLGGSYATTEAGLAGNTDQKGQQ